MITKKNKEDKKAHTKGTSSTKFRTKKKGAAAKTTTQKKTTATATTMNKKIKKRKKSAVATTDTMKKKDETKKVVVAQKKGTSSMQIQMKKKGTAAKTKTQKKPIATTKNKEETMDPELIKAKLTERINSIPRSDKNSFELKWISEPISTIDEKKVANRIVIKGCYGPLDTQQMTKIQNEIKSTPFTLSQALSLRSEYLRQKVMYRHDYLRKNAKNVCQQYRMGHSVLDLAKKADQPPMNVLRTILSEMKWSKPKIKNALSDPRKFEARERNEFLAAESADMVSTANPEIHEISEKFEDIFSIWLEEKGIRFARQKELEKEQKEEFGKAILTPDFLLLDRVDINGVPCHWVDCKAFYGANLGFTIKKTKRQMKKYIEQWGSGAIVYSQGFSEAIQIEDCALLAARGVLCMKSLTQLEQQICAAVNKISLTTLTDNAAKK